MEAWESFNLEAESDAKPSGFSYVFCLEQSSTSFDIFWILTP